MHKDINIDEAMKINGAGFIDVRSPHEYDEACIPGAINIPLLDDDERRQVGIIYKKQSPEQAKIKALNLVSPKLPKIVEECKKIAEKKSIVLYCWRGGMRSKALSNILDIMGVPYLRLAGGFKAYRRYVNKYFTKETEHKVVVIHGLTGVGKTEVIEELQAIGVAAVDLEGLANNRGSVFGSVGLDSQPSQKMFEGSLAKELRELESEGYVVVEGESRRIGRLIIPETFFNAMQDGLTVLLYCSIEKRIERIKRIYTEGPNNNVKALTQAVEALTKRLGKKQVQDLKEMITQNRFEEAVRILLVDYYDPLYKYPNHPDDSYDISIDSADPLKAAKEIKEFLTSQNYLGGELLGWNRRDP